MGIFDSLKGMFGGKHNQPNNGGVATPTDSINQPNTGEAINPISPPAQSADLGSDQSAPIAPSVEPAPQVQPEQQPESGENQQQPPITPPSA